MNRINYSRDQLLTDYWGCVRQTIQKFNDKVFYVTKSGAVTYSQANQRANVIYEAIQKQFEGYGFGVGLYLKSPSQIIPGMMGIIKSRNYCIPLDVNFPIETLRSMIEIAGIKIVLTNNAHYSLISSLAGAGLAVINIEDLNYEAVVPDPQVDYSPEDVVQILFTSGSTGIPKGAVEDYRYLVRAVDLKLSFQNFETGDHCLHLSSFTFSGTHTLVFTALVCGLTIFYYDVKEEGLTGLPDWIRRMEVNSYSSTPTVFRSLVSILEPGETFPLVKKINFGGEKRYPKDFQAVREHFPSVKNYRLGFASTETQSATMTIYPIGHDFGNKNLPSGKSLDDIKIFIWDKNGKSLPPGEEGEIVVCGDSLVRGYINNPKLTSAHFIPIPDQPGWQYFKTGDLGKLLPGGELMHLGRIDNMVKIKGVRIELSSIENHMLSYPGIILVATKAFEDGQGNGRLAAYYETEKGIHVPGSDLRKYLAERLPRHLLPHYLIHLEEIPLTRNGKVAGTMLPLPQMIRPELPNAFVSPESDLEKKLVEIWEEQIGVEGIGVTDDFFDLGGDSLIGVMVFARIEETLDRKLPVSILLTASTIRKQVDLIQEQQDGHSFDPVIHINGQGNYPPLYFIPGKAGYPTRIRHLAQKLDARTPVYALQNISKDGDALRFRSIESMAAYYLDAIKKTHPHGPYYFVGESMGGRIAFEMARQLKEQGEKVPVLALLDTYNSSESVPRVYFEKDKKILPYYWMLMRKHIFILWHSDWQGRLDYLKFYRQTGAPKIKEFIKQPKNKAKINRSIALPENVRQMEMDNMRANKKYEARPYPGRVILFKALRNANVNVLSNGWSDVELGELMIHTLDCYHGSILFDPAVSQLAGILQDYIDKDIQESTQQ